MKKMSFSKPLLIIFCIFCLKSVKCQLFSLGISSIPVIGSYLYDKYYCSYRECCTDTYIHPNFEKLNKLLIEKVYGQHIVRQIIVSALRGHFENNQQSKALALSFHGPPGTGKNYVAKFIVDTIYKHGFDSKYVHYYYGRAEFSLDSNLISYQERLTKEVKSGLEECERSIFIFDEVEKMAEGLLNCLIPFMDYNTFNSKHYKNKGIFIFLSNTGSREIIKQSLNLWKNGVKRSDTKIQDFEHLIAQGAFNENGGFHHSEAIDSHVIDHYVPFLPLEENHIKKCIMDELDKKNINITDNLIKEGLSHIVFGPTPYDLYSTSGCKKVRQKVATMIYK